ncbi:hypothetical protein ACU686_26825 [Yinghuangia aomiensis]
MGVCLGNRRWRRRSAPAGSSTRSARRGAAAVRHEPRPGRRRDRRTDQTPHARSFGRLLARRTTQGEHRPAPQVNAYYRESGQLCAIAIDALREAIVAWSKVPLVGGVPSQTEERLMTHAEAAGFDNSSTRRTASPSKRPRTADARAARRRHPADPAGVRGPHMG